MCFERFDVIDISQRPWKKTPLLQRKAKANEENELIFI